MSAGRILPPKAGYRRPLKRQNQKKIIEFKKELIP